MSELALQHERWTEARGRLMGGIAQVSPPKLALVPPLPARGRGRPKGTPNFRKYGPAFEWQHIVYEVAEKHGLSRPELMSHRRCKPIIIARQELFYRLSKETSMSLPEMGRKGGGFDHTTVLHSIRMHKKRLEAQPADRGDNADLLLASLNPEESMEDRPNTETVFET